jgi:hypothetical protein
MNRRDRQIARQIGEARKALHRLEQIRNAAAEKFNAELKNFSHSDRVASVIVKVQLPISGDTSKALIYDNPRTFFMLYPISDEFMAQVKGQLRSFWKAELEWPKSEENVVRIREAPKIRLLEQVPDPGWR